MWACYPRCPVLTTKTSAYACTQHTQLFIIDVFIAAILDQESDLALFVFVIKCGFSTWVGSSLKLDPSGNSEFVAFNGRFEHVLLLLYL